MPSQRAKGKKNVVWWATEEERRAMKEAYTAAGFKNLGQYLRWVASAKPLPPFRAPTSSSTAKAGKKAKTKDD